VTASDPHIEVISGGVIMPLSKQRRALIIGGSLGGLFNAIMLRTLGWHVEVFERTPHPLDSRGGGIVLQPEVVRLLELAGLLNGLTLGVDAKERLYLDRTGAIIHRIGMRQTLTSWPMLYNTMRRSIPAESYHLDAKLVAIEEFGDSVTAIFSDGQKFSGDLLIGADGVNSTVRFLKLPESKPVYAGYVAWRGLVKEGELDQAVAELLSERFVFQQFPGSHILEYLIPAIDGSIRPGDRSFNWVWYRNVAAHELGPLLTDRNGRSRTTSVPPGLISDAFAEEMRQAARNLLAPQMASLVLATKEPFIQAILDLWVPKMVFGRVIITGDAAFAPRPHTAASTSKAASNAIDLVQALQDIPDDIQEALNWWQLDQIKLGNALLTQGQQLGNQSQFPERE
jgi:2-polyprenyl-6-methoxyphenol hydroxylase-like FAD-dependent oxidoreductase